MNQKNIAKALSAKMKDWVKTVEEDNPKIAKIIKDSAIITGGAIVSLLQGEKPNDYDVYFKNIDDLYKVAVYYADKWNATHPTHVEIKQGKDFMGEQRVSCWIQSRGAVMEEGEDGIDDDTEPYTSENGENPTQPNPEIQKPKYRPRYFSANAISLSDDIQLVIRFYGSVEEIHKNYDFIHTTCSYDFASNEVELPARALEAIINKELYYVGSKYPLCSIIRSRKFIQRGWSINAGQYLKMCLQLNELNLKDLNVFKDQLCGVDSAYFSAAIEFITQRKEKEPDFTIDNEYLFEIINRIF